MYGLEAISNANGWAMASVGASIVITGLSVLSFLISQFKHVVSLFENQKIEVHKSNSNIQKNNIVEKVPYNFSGTLEETFNLYTSVTKELGNNFSLSDLYQVSNKLGLPHPYISIRNLRNNGFLVSLGEGLFSWKLIPA